MTFPFPNYTDADLPFHADGYDRRRDDRLDFPRTNGRPTSSSKSATKVARSWTNPMPNPDTYIVYLVYVELDGGEERRIAGAFSAITQAHSFIGAVERGKRDDHYIEELVVEDG